MSHDNCPEPDPLGSADHCDKGCRPLPAVEALMAGTLALLTAYAHSAPECPHRPLMAAKLVSNLAQLAAHPQLGGPMRTVLGNLRLRWQLAEAAQASPTAALNATPLWHASPAAVQ